MNTHNTPSPFYPLFLNLRGRRVVVIGGGAVAERKVKGLLRGAADVVVISPALTPGLEQSADNRRMTVIRRVYRSGDLAGAALVFAATDRPEVNRAVAAEGAERGVWVNVADQVVPGDFIVPAVFSAAGVTVAVSSGGVDPALAARVRNRIQAILSVDPPEEEHDGA